jgi:hypothetical protein
MSSDTWLMIDDFERIWKETVEDNLQVFCGATE